MGAVVTTSLLLIDFFSYYCNLFVSFFSQQETRQGSAWESAGSDEH